MASGTDTIRSLLTPGEEVIRQPAASMMQSRFQGALEYINQPGALAPQQPTPMSTRHVYVENPLIGQFVEVVSKVADLRIGDSARDGAHLRIGA